MNGRICLLGVVFLLELNHIYYYFFNFSKRWQIVARTAHSTKRATAWPSNSACRSNPRTWLGSWARSERESRFRHVKVQTYSWAFNHQLNLLV